MNSGVSVELRGIHGEFYPGHIVGFNEPEKLIFKFNDDKPLACPSEIVVSPSLLRKPPRKNLSECNGGELLIGKTIEVILGQSCPENPDLNNTPSSWWPATVSKQRGEFILFDILKYPEVNFSGIQCIDNLRIPLPNFENVAEKKQVRELNVQKMLSASDFHTHILKIPQNLVEHFKDSKNMQHVIGTCGQPLLICQVTKEMVLPNECTVDLSNETIGYFLVLSLSADGIFKAKTLEPELVRMLRQKLTIMNQINEISRQLKVNQSNAGESLIYDEFAVSPDLIGQSIGAKGANIRRARTLDGIVSVVLNPELCTFKVSGKTKEAVDNAKNVLEYATEVMQVPQEYVARIIGQKNRHIQTLVDRVGLARIRVQNPEEASSPNCVPFAFTGTRSAINDAKLLISFNIESLKEIDRLQSSITSDNHSMKNRMNNDADNYYKRERSSKSTSEGRYDSGNRRAPAQNVNFNGDGMHSNISVKTDVPMHYRENSRPGPRNNKQRNRESYHVPNGDRQSSLTSNVSKSDDKNVFGASTNENPGNTEYRYHTGTMPRGENNQKRNTRRIPNEMPINAAT